MNYLAHCLMASWDQPQRGLAFVFGAMAPDFAGMGSSKLDYKLPPSEFAEGVGFHYRTDEIFDSLAEVKSLAEFIREHLIEIDFPRGGRLGCTEIASELLLDGFVQAHYPGVVELHHQAVGEVANGGLDLRSAGVSDWEKIQELLRMRSRRGLPDYQDTSHVARALQWRIGLKPRLAFGEEFIPSLTEVLNCFQTEVFEVAEVILQKTAKELRG